MEKKELLAKASIGIHYCGYKLQSPFILTSGPLSYGAEGMIRAHGAGCGAVVTKTIRLQAAVNPPHHMGTVGRESLINCEKWSDIDRLRWYEQEIPQAVAAGVTVIASVGHTLQEAQAIAEDAEKAGAHMIELVSYTEDTLVPMLDYVKTHVGIPVICKLSANWPDAVAAARKCLEHGADGLCAIDSIGPTLKIDIHRARPELESENGYGWLTGEAIRPIALRINAEIARNHPGLRSLYASGGCMRPEHAVEYLMAGAMGVGICTAAILNGTGYIEKLCQGLSKLLFQLGYSSVEEAFRAALPNFPQKEAEGVLSFSFTPYREDGSRLCISCGHCAQVCCYGARVLEFPMMRLDRSRCRSCGLCTDVCPTGALKITHASEALDVVLENSRLGRD